MMFKGIVGACFVVLLAGCGGGGSSSGSEAVEDNNLTEDVDPYLGRWERNCIRSYNFDMYGLQVPIDVDIYEDESLSIYREEVFTVDTESVVLSTEFFSDESCADAYSISRKFKFNLELENAAGETQVRGEWVSRHGYNFVRFSDDLLLAGTEPFPVGLYHVDDRLYAVEPLTSNPVFAFEVNYVVNFNKYYTRVLD